MLISNYEALRKIKRDVNTRRFNRIVRARKIRLASFVAAPILRKTFHNKALVSLANTTVR